MRKGVVIFLILVFAFAVSVNADCTDSDNGQNILSLGVTSNDTYRFIDFCEDENHVNEAVCKGENVDLKLNIACKGGNHCNNGRCTPVFGIIPPCEDTDGKSYTTFGVVTQGNDIIMRDFCIGDRLTEAYCDAGSAWTSNWNCRFGCSNGACLPKPPAVNEPDEPDNNAEGDEPVMQVLPEEMPHCEATSLFWTDGFSNNLMEAGIGLPVYAYITGDGCDGASVTLSVLDSDDDSVVGELGTFDFAYDDFSSSWYAYSQWIPGAAGNYYILAIVNEAVPGLTYTLDNFDNPLQVLGDCEPEILDGESCGTDPVTGQALIAGNDYDCDGVDDCLDQWVYNYGGDVDPDTGIPADADSHLVGISGCLDDWDCTNAEWGACLKNAEGRLTRSRDISLCTLPPGNNCPYRPTQERVCLQEEKFPVFGWMNLLLVSLLLAGYYFIKRY